MSFFYGGKFFDKRGCYVILPASPFGRFDLNDNTAEADEEIEVLEGPEVEIVGTYDDSILNYSDMESNKSDNENINVSDAESKVNHHQSGMEPDNKYYEVEAIIDGPKKRREHLFKLCYKVRWKGYGPEADTWQPLTDLDNVKDMIEEYKMEKKAKEVKQKRKKPLKEALSEDSKPQMSPSPTYYEKEEESKQYDPEYGTVKDKFWKDLEKGNTDRYAALFNHDMYSKIKGSQRTAHAEAVANIHKQHTHRKPLIHSTLSIKASSSVTSIKRRRGSQNTSPPNSAKSSRELKPQLLIANKSRKRLCDPFSAKGYTSSKRSRRSKELKSVIYSPERKRSSISSVTSETLAIVTTTSPVLTPPVLPNSSTVPFFNTEPGLTTITYSHPKTSENYKSSDDEDESDGNSRMTVTSETMLTITTEAKLLDTEIISPESVSSKNLSQNFIENKTENCDESVFHSSNSNEVTRTRNIPSPPLVNKRSTLDTQSEAEGAVERSHDTECLWGGACNRSDCRANRRFNRKNGKEQTSEENVQSENDSSHLPDNPEQAGENQTCSSSGTKATDGTKKDSPSQQSLPTQKKFFSSSAQAYSSDSSFEEFMNPAEPLSRDAIKNSFSCTETQPHPSVGSSGTKRNISFESATTLLYGSRKTTEMSERPGLFSESNSAFSFVKHNLGASHTEPLPPSNIHLSSPGKENFGSELKVSSSGSSQDRLLMMDAHSPEVHFESPSPVQSRNFVEAALEVRHRKRTNDLSQPLEKIPSPNSRQDLDLDRRISTLTCDELEDLVEQGEEKFSYKEASFVTNADLLQSVNLSKAEVVKRAIKQSSLTEKKLDFEQPDKTGLTLLMKAVQKGALGIVELLLEQGVDVNSQQTNGTTALMMAAEVNSVCLVALLLKYGANSSLYTVHCDQAETALMKAIKRQHKEVVNLLLRVGVNIAAPTCTSISALDLAVERRNSQIENLVRSHYQRLEQAFRSRVLVTLEETAELMDPLFPLQCFPLRESQQFVVKFNSNIHPVAQGEGFLLFIAHTKINDKGVKCRFHGSCPIGSVTLNGVLQTPLTKEVNFVTSCHPIIPGCNTLVIHKLEDYTSKAKLTVQAFRAKLLPC